MLTISREDAEEMLADLMDPETDWDPPEHFEKAKKFALDAFVHYVDHINRLHCSPVQNPMLIDIVARLRDPRWTHPPHSLLLEAAVEIERLRKSPDKTLMERVVAFINEADPFGDRFSAHDLERLTSGQRSEEGANK